MKTSNTPRNFSGLHALMIAGLVIGSAGTASAFSKSKSFSGGNSNLGGSVQLSASDSASSSSYKISANASAKANLVGYSATVATADGSLSATKSYTGNAQLRITAAGSTLVNYNRNFSASASFSTSTYTKKIKLGSAVFIAGGVPIKVTANASLSVYGTGSASIKKSGGVTVVEGSVGPVFDLAASASGEATVIVGSAGIEGSATLLSTSLIGKARLYPSGTKGYVDYGADWGFRGPNGKLDVYAKVYVPFVGTKKFTYNLGSFSSGRTTGALSSGTTRLW